MVDEVIESLHKLDNLFVEAFTAKIDQMINCEGETPCPEQVPATICEDNRRPRRESLLSRRALSIQTRTGEQRENLFYTRCQVKEKLCSLVIDGGSCVNMASETLVQKLELEVRDHPNPYEIHWLSENGAFSNSKSYFYVFLLFRGVVFRGVSRPTPRLLFSLLLSLYFDEPLM